MRILFIVTWLMNESILGGTTQQTIVGRCKRSDDDADNNNGQQCVVVQRTKRGKIKKMACPFALVGSTFDSIQTALQIWLVTRRGDKKI